MPGQLRKILVLGSTGVIGRYIIKAIASAAPTSFDRVAIFTSQNTVNTKTEQIQWLKDHGVEIIVGDLNDEARVREVYQGTRLFSTPTIFLSDAYPRIRHNRKLPRAEHDRRSD
jgi:nucleoside-diphosphate-sugar epimerase